jgi:hypothetical protein
MSSSKSDLYILAWQRVKQLTNNELLCFACSKNALVRDMVIREFHVRPSREVFEIAVTLVHAKPARAREVGFLILGQLGSPNRPFRNDSMPMIMQGLKSEKSVFVQCAIAYAIGHLVPPQELHGKIIDGLLRYLDDNRESLQIAVAFAIAGLSNSDQLNRIVEKLLSYGNLDVREWVEISLEAIQSRK